MKSQRTVLNKNILSSLLIFVSVVAYAQSPVASFSVNVNSGCQPLSVQFNNTSQNAVSYYWAFGNGNTSNLANPSNVYNLSGNYTVTLTAYDASGNSDVKTITNCITVIPTPVAAFTSNISNACEGYGIIQFTNSSLNFDSCIWDFGDGTKSNVFNPVHQYSLAGTFTVSLIVFNSPFHCSDILSQSQFITIHPKPVVSVNVNSTFTCDSTYAFSFTAAGSNMNSWNWSFGDGTFSVLQNPFHSYNQSGNFNVKLITTSTFGCKDTSFLNSVITVQNNPVPIITASDSVGCSPTTINFNTNITNAQWLWSFGDGDSAFIRNPVHVYDSIGTFYVGLQVIYSNGCSQQVVLNNYINILDAPHPTFVLVNRIGCAPLTVQFNNTTPGTYTYVWDFGDGTTSTSVNTTHTYDTIGTFIPSLTAISSNGCSKTALTSWYGVSVTGPAADFSANITSGCPPLSVHFTDHSMNATQWLWDFGDGFTSTQQHPSHNFNTGSYIVTLIVTDALGCKDTLVSSNAISVTAPVNNFLPSTPVTACAPFTANLSDNSGALSCVWNFGDGTSSTLQNPTHVYNQPGTYTVSLTTQSASGGCSQYIADYSIFIIKGGVAYFTHTETHCPPYQAFFTDSSTNAISWFWDFGDGTTSTLQNPTHTYTRMGYFDVSLTITTNDGCTTTYIQNYGVHFTSFGAHATAFTNDTVPPFTVNYFAGSIGVTSWLWNFGDGTTSTLEDPVHVYNSAGPFTISLTVTGDSCTYTYNYPPVSFGGGGVIVPGGGSGGGTPPPLEYDCVPYIVNFSNPVPNAVTWLWDFGDNTTSSLPDPMHTYLDTGMYQVILYTTDSTGDVDTLIFPKVFNIKKADSDFTINTTNTCNGVLVSLSTLAPAASYDWSFGDGATSTLSNPSHTYPNIASNYILSFNVTDTNGCSAYSTQTYYSTVNNPLSASVQETCAGDTVNFNCGSINYSSYLWDFGDGNISNSKDPFHVYNDSGIYNVSLTVTDVNGCTNNYILQNGIEVFKPVADFSVSPPLSSCTWVRVLLTNLSTGADHYLWDFDTTAGTSTAVNPPVYYYGLGYHDIKLTAYKNMCSSSKTISNVVYVPNRSVNFSYAVNSECLPVTAVFTDQSVDAVSWLWDFGDGNTSTLRNPSHVYNIVPYTDITLSITDTNGCTVSLTKPKPAMSYASFSVSTTNGCNPTSVLFSDSSGNVISWHWSFGDGDTSSLQSPVHIYDNNGIYNVQLIVQGTSGCYDTLNLDSIITISSSTAAFTSNNTFECLPLVADFTDASSNAVSWLWNFGDGSTSSNQNPSHIYNLPGVYTVTLIVTNALGCSDTLVRNDYITVRGSLPSFTLSDSSGCNPVTVSFTDQSQGAIGWQWNFGDGATDSIISPVHTYNLAGTFIITLITEDTTGCFTSFTYPNPVQVSQMPVALFSVNNTVGCSPLIVSFNNQSTNADSVLWVFGDGTTSTDFSPVHAYNIAGSYTIMLIATNAGGCIDTFLLSQSVIVYPQPQADFTSDITEGCATLPVNFTNGSSNLYSPAFHWDFGNGDTSDIQNPTELFTTPGIYDISLTVTNEGGCMDVMLKNAYIRVYDQAPPPVSDMRSVSVVSNSAVEIAWDLCTSTDFNYYTLFRLDSMSGVYDSISSFNQGNVSMSQGYPVYTDNNLNTLNNTYTYLIQTTDLCGNKQDTSFSTSHSTINLTASVAGKAVELNWTPYENCSVAAYEIYRQDNETGSYVNIASVPSSVINFIDTTTYCPFKYAYKVRATALCGDQHFVSWSDSAMAQPQSDILLQQVEIVRSTVVNDHYILTEWKPPVIAPATVMGYKILRSGDQVNYVEIATVSSAELSYSDYNVDVHNYQYFYKISVINQCNIETTPLDKSSSVLLKGDYNDLTSRLRWTKYLQWDTGVEKYVIEKKDEQGMWQIIKIVDGNTTEMEDE